MQIATTTSLRRGFSLIELLVVIAIISVIATIATGVLFRVRAGAEIQATETTMRKFDSLLQQQVKAVVDTARDDTVPPIVIDQLARGNKNRGRVIWTKMKLRQEFPQNFGEALNGINIPFPSTLILRRKENYARKLGPVTVAGGFNALEAAVMLTESLAESRRGITITDGDTRGSAGTAKITVGGREFMVAQDNWGQPLVLIRWPWPTSTPAQVAFSSALASELNAPPYVSPEQAISGKIDPVDPENWLGQGWNGGNPAGNELANLTAAIGHPLPAQNYAPFILSAGPDKVLFTGDDICSFRLRELGKRGN